jgi:hypothetical protein
MKADAASVMHAGAKMPNTSVSEPKEMHVPRDGKAAAELQETKAREKAMEAKVCLIMQVAYC